jgi:hypothetical protein
MPAHVMPAEAGIHDTGELLGELLAGRLWAMP